MSRAIVSLVILALLVIAAKPSASSGPQPLHFDSFGFTEKQNPVEQYSDWPWLPGPLDCSATEHCIVNPTPCSWDVDDHWRKFAFGYLPAGGSASDVSCVIASQNPVYRTVSGTTAWWSTVNDRFTAQISAPSPSLMVTISWSPQGRLFTLAAVYDAATRLYRYGMCVRATYSPDDPALVLIPGSNASSVVGTVDALGLPSTITFTIANPTGKQVRNINGSIGMTGSAACALSGQSSYPFAW